MMLVEAFERLLDVLWANDVITTQDKELIRGNRPHGEWVFDKDGSFSCSVCNKKPHDQTRTTTYCPHCGAYLVGVRHINDNRDGWVAMSE